MTTTLVEPAERSTIATVITPTTEGDVNPKGSFTLAHNGSEWTSTFTAAARYVLSMELADGPLDVNLLIERTADTAQTSEVAGALVQMTDTHLIFDDGVQIAFEDLLGLWY